MGVAYQYFAAIAATLGALSAGTALGWTSNLESKVVGGKDYGFEVESIKWATMGSILNIGAALGCVFTGKIADSLGRRKALILISLPFIFGWAFLVFAMNPVMLIIGRFIIGLACGGICVVGPMYVAEIAEKSIRGTLCSLFQFQITGGILLVYILGAFASTRVTCWICAVVPVAFLILVYFSAESPNFLVRKRQHEEAIECLMKFRNPNYEPIVEITELEKEEEARRSENFKQALSKKSSKKAIFIGLSLMFFQQLSGINAVIFYTSSIFNDANVSLQPEIATIIVGVIQVIATFIATATIDKIGRKILLVLSGALMALCTLSLGIFYSAKQSNPDSVFDYGWVSLASLCVFIIAFSLGFGPVPWLMIGELFSSDIKGPASSGCAFMNWFLAFVVTISYPPLKEAIYPSNCFFIFTAVSLVGVFFSLFIVPETKGKTLKEIQDLLGKE